MVTKLNLGCGTDYREGYINIDIDPDIKTDWCGDACMMPGLWAESFHEIYARHSLEHFHDLLTIVKEMVRVSKDGAIWTIIVPYWSWSQNQGNPYHHIYFSEHTFDFFGQKYKRGHKEDWTLEVLDVKYGWNEEFEPPIIRYDYHPNAIRKLSRTECMHMYLNVVKDITFTIKVRK